MKRKNCFSALVLLSWFVSQTAAQEFTIYNTRPIGLSDATGISNWEPLSYAYNFIAPLNSSLLCKNGKQGAPPPGKMLNEGEFCANLSLYEPSFNTRYFMSLFGPRMQTSSGSIISVYDFHRGKDIIDGKEPTNGSDMPNIQCACDGIVHKIFDEADLPAGQSIENTEEGRYVVVKCNASFSGSNAAWGNIYTVYRHLSEINTSLAENTTISRGGLIGKMGSSGITNTNHLHFSVQKKVSNKFINVHPGRLFNNGYNLHLVAPVNAAPLAAANADNERVHIILLDSSNTSSNPDDNWAVIRVAIPYNKTFVRAIAIKNGTYSEQVDFEALNEERDGNAAWLDDPVVGQLRMSVFPFNRGQSAYARFDSIKGALVNFPDHTGNQYPIPNTGIFTTPAYVLDIKAKGLPKNFSVSEFEVFVADIWGRGVRGTL